MYWCIRYTYKKHWRSNGTDQLIIDCVQIRKCIRVSAQSETVKMISLILLNLCFIIFVYNFYKYAFYRPAKFPPGPPKVPWFGSYIFMLLLNRNHLHLAMNKISKFYKSKIIGMHFGDVPVVVLNDNQSVKMALNHRDFDGRPDLLMGRLRDPNLNKHGLCPLIFEFTEICGINFIICARNFLHGW